MLVLNESVNYILMGVSIRCGEGTILNLDQNLLMRIPVVGPGAGQQQTPE